MMDNARKRQAWLSFLLLTLAIFTQPGDCRIGVDHHRALRPLHNEKYRKNAVSTSVVHRQRGLMSKKMDKSKKKSFGKEESKKSQGSMKKKPEESSAPSTLTPTSQPTVSSAPSISSPPSFVPSNTPSQMPSLPSSSSKDTGKSKNMGMMATSKSMSMSMSKSMSMSATGRPTTAPAPTTFGPSTIAPTARSSGTASPTKPNLATEPPISGNTKAPTKAPATMGPSTQGPTNENFPAAKAPTKSPQATESPGTPVPSTTSTPPPTTEQTCVVAPTGLPASQYPDCEDNPREYTVNIDIQINFVDEEFAACDSQEQDSCINSNVAIILNEAFPTTVSDWQGLVSFGTFVFDIDQEVNNVDPFARERRVLLDSHYAKAARKLQEGGCPARDIECLADFCRWGCITATTTDCGASALTKWVNLAEDVRARLSTLGYDCLGIADQLEVILIVDEAATGIATREGNVNKKSVSDPSSILLGSNGEEVDGTEDDAPTKTLQARGDLEFHFFEGYAEAPDDAEITALIRETKAFFTDRLSTDRKFAADFVQVDLDNVNHRYFREASSNKDTFELSFIANVLVLRASKLNRKDITSAMGSYDFKEFISSYVWASPPFQRNQFYETNWVSFTSKDANRGEH